MLTAGLVSLNVHDSLTFEGTEICLHPDLFSPQAGDGSFAGSASARHSISTKEHHRLHIAPAASLDDKFMSQKLLQVGDFVEIRVWDPLPRAPPSTTPPSPPNSFRKHRSTTPIPTLSPPISAQSSTSEPEKSNQATATREDLEAAAANLHSRPQSEGTRVTSGGKDSMQYSDSASPSPDGKDEGEDNNPKEGDTSSAASSEERSHSIIPEHTAQASPNALSPHNDDSLPTKTVITSGDLPPVFPRSRTNTADGAIHIRSSTQQPPLISSKPPIAQRRPTFSDSYTQKPRQPFKSRHTRDLSDMTMDTVYTHDTKTQALDSTHQWVDMQLPAPLSDDEDESWTQPLSTHSLRLSFVMLVTEESLTSLKGSARTQVSLLRQVADLYELSSYDMVTIHKIEREEREAVLQAVSADFVVVTIKDQFISRGDMHFFQKTLIDSWIYEGQRLHEPNRGIQANAREIRHGDHLARSGIVTEDTKITYRSRSARIFWLVQVSAEMWDYASPYERGREESLCELYFDRFISFVYELFAKWKEIEATHSLNVVFFSRTFLTTGPAFNESDMSRLDQKDVYGRLYEDHYRTVIENETRSDWESLVRRIKEAFVRYPHEIGWNLSTGGDGRRPSTASQGNVLEAINVTLNLLQYHYLDRDLQRTGNSIVLVSAGSGIFEVDKGLASITYQRMMDHGIGSDMLSLGLPPLHIAPFFLYVNVYQSVETDGVDASESYFEVPHWMHLSFLSYESDSTVPGSRENGGKEDLKGNLNPSGLEIGANGFLLSRNTRKAFDPSSESSPLLQPAGCFSRRGNAAASPPIKKQKPLTQERQLIAGRDFRDILEACRPRHGGLIPSALKTLLALHERASEDDRKTDDSKKGEEAGEEKAFAIEEWGALDFKEKSDGSLRLGRRMMPIVQDGLEHPSPVLGPIPSPPRVDELDRPVVAETLSPSLSYTSVMGVSFDRPFLAHQGSPSLTGIQMQRAPSLEIEVIDDNDDGGSEGALSERSLSSSGFDTAGDSSIEDTVRDSNRTKHDSEKLVEQLQQTMRMHDLNAFVESPKLSAVSEPVQVRHDPLDSSRHGQIGAPSQVPSLGMLSEQVRPSGGQDVSTGGIGAALSQYRSTSISSGVIRNDQDGPSALLSRVVSSGRMTGTSPGLNQIHEMGSRGLSPLILPPVAALSTTDPPDILRRDGGSLSGRSMLQRLVHPQEFSRQMGGEAAGGFRQSDASLSRRNVSASRDGEGADKRRFWRDGPLSSSPPKAGASVQGSVSRAATIRIANREPAISRRRGGAASRRKKAFNPFRQQDEDEVLAKKSHNRRRWSHVFPLGEVEFKRHAGPNWKSLSSPAILPLSIDYFPPQNEIDHNYTHGFHNVTLSEFENTLYSSNKDLLMEMVRQRITQDYQLVPPSHVNASNYRRESLRDGLANPTRSVGRSEDNPETIRKFLSMGHQLQVLTYDASSDIIEVTRHIAKSTQQNEAGNSFKYHYLGYCEETGKYTNVVQTFNKYAEQYNWNKVDRIICGDEDREMRDGMRFRRIMFALIPDHFDDVAAEQGYIAKFVRLVEYLNKLREKEESESTLNIKIVSSEDKKDDKADHLFSTPGIDRNSMQKFFVQLRKSKRVTYEWMEVAVDSTFDTSWSYRIMFNWLVASSGKVDTQIQLLQRRCTQFGLTLVPVPQTSVSRTVYLNPFKAPAIFTVRNKDKVSLLDPALVGIGFLHDGVFYTDARAVIECMEKGDEFDFGQRWSRQPAGRQFIHRSGTLFVRILTDRNGLAILVVFRNYRYTARDESLLPKAEAAFRDLSRTINSLVKETDDLVAKKQDSDNKPASATSKT